MKVLKFLLEWLIPAAALSDPFEQRRARVFGVLCVLLFVVGNARAAAFFWVGDYPLAVAHLLLVGSAAAAPLLIRRGWGLRWPTHGYTLLVWSIITLVSAKQGVLGRPRRSTR